MKKPIRVRTRSRPAPYFDPFLVYLSLIHRLGKKHVYMLESLSGPAEDVRSAIIGLGHLLTLNISQDRVTFEGVPELVELATSECIEQGSLRREGDELRLTSRPALWSVLRDVEQMFLVESASSHQEFRFGYFGYMGYDTAWSIEELPRLIEEEADIPDLCFMLHHTTIIYDLRKQAAQLYLNVADPWRAEMPKAEATIAQVIFDPTKWPTLVSAPGPNAVHDSTNMEAFVKNANLALEHVRAGDVYQLQLGHEVRISSNADPTSVYQRLRAYNPSPYMYIADIAGITLLGASPEMFVRIEDGQVMMRPIAGTAKRGKNLQDDQLRSYYLRCDEKERAEHLMLVDLCRNDVGRVTTPESLQVTELMKCESYSHVIHLVSTVVGTMSSDVDKYDVLAATFPAGTMTGAPKVRAMELIESFETSRRGVYAGCVGVIDFGGYVNTALCIRSATHSDNVYRIRASAGIVADSVPEKEWQETLAKLAAPFRAIASQEIPDDYTGN